MILYLPSSGADEGWMRVAMVTSRRGQPLQSMTCWSDWLTSWGTLGPLCSAMIVSFIFWSICGPSLDVRTSSVSSVVDDRVNVLSSASLPVHSRFTWIRLAALVCFNLSPSKVARTALQYLRYYITKQNGAWVPSSHVLIILTYPTNRTIFRFYYAHWFQLLVLCGSLK